MMVSTMRCCGKRLRTFFCSVLLLFTALGALAAEIEIRNPQLNAEDDAYILSADFSMDFNVRLEEAVAKGVVLYFITEFELARPRWYWLDEKVISRTQTFRLSYHALTRQYRLSTGALHQSFETLDQALRMLTHLRNWNVVERSALKVDETYLAALRVRLDLTQMPKTFQVTAIANRDWNLASDWARWSFVPTDSKTGASENK